MGGGGKYSFVGRAFGQVTVLTTYTQHPFRHTARVGLRTVIYDLTGVIWVGSVRFVRAIAWYCKYKHASVFLFAHRMDEKCPDIMWQMLQEERNNRC